YPEHGAKRTKLEPACKDLRITSVRCILGAKEPANIGIAIRDAANRKIQPRRNLLPKVLPAAPNVARPRNCRITLLTRVCGTRKDDDPLLVRLSTLTLVDASGMHQRVGVEHLRTRPTCS